MLRKMVHWLRRPLQLPAEFCNPEYAKDKEVKTEREEHNMEAPRSPNIGQIEIAVAFICFRLGCASGMQTDGGSGYYRPLCQNFIPILLRCRKARCTRKMVDHSGFHPTRGQ